MAEHDVERASTTEGLPVSPSLGPTLEAAQLPAQPGLVDRRVVLLSCISIVLGIAAGFVAQALVRLISLVTNAAYHGRISAHFAAPANTWGLWTILIPVIGGVVVGVMARYGSKAIRGHGIPEAMEQVLLNQSRIPARLTFLKPLSAAIAIGTGGPFGAEGPIIATGGALGSLVGQIMETTATERKTLLSAGAAAGMAATFGAPVSAVLLAIELLLFEFRPRSIIPVALAATAAAAMRAGFEGVEPVFRMAGEALLAPTGIAMAAYIVVGALLGFTAVLVTRAVYAIEDAFELLPVHWMWWPAIGGIAVGVVGYFAPRTLGVGYTNISGILSGEMNDSLGVVPLTLVFVAMLCLAKFVSWAIALGSGTSGGTLAPLFTIGGALGFVLGVLMKRYLPNAGIDPRVAALVGMAAMFAGASRALLTSVVFAFETTLQPLGLLPLLGGCSAAFLVASLMARHSIMTEKIARRGVRVPAEYSADFLDQVLVRDIARRSVVTLAAPQTIAEVRHWMDSGLPGSSHQGYPVIDENRRLIGVVTRRSLTDSKKPPETRVGELLSRRPIIIRDDRTLRDAADLMVHHDVGRLPVVDAQDGGLIGFLTRSDILAAHRKRLSDTHQTVRSFRFSAFRRTRRSLAQQGASRGNFT